MTVETILGRAKWYLRRSLGYWYSRQVVRLSPHAGIHVKSLRPRVLISKAMDAEIQLGGKLLIEPWMGGTEPVRIVCGRGSRLVIDGDFQIGGGTRIFLDEGAELRIGGRKYESVSGITERSLIMVRRKVSIGTDFICAWNVFITDCDWHGIVGQQCHEDTTIGDHVWIAPGASVLKGSSIGEGSIISTGAVVHKISIPAMCLAGGVPCRVLAQGKAWRREPPSLWQACA